MRRTLTFLSAMILTACSTGVADLDDLRTDQDACDPRGRTARGTDLDLQFDEVTPHVNQDMFFALTVGRTRSIEGIMVLSALDDPDLHLVVPKFLPEGPSELAFWADSLSIDQDDDGGVPSVGFDPINNNGGPIDHQWTRPVCPNGKLRFTHNTPFQSVEDAISTGAIFDFQIPEELQRSALFDTFHIWVRAVQLSADGETEAQTRAFYRWSPLVAPARGIAVPEQRVPPTHFQVGGNALGEPRGAIDQLSLYRIEFVIDLDDSGDLGPEDYACISKEQAPDAMTWTFTPDTDECDKPDDFDPLTFEP